MTDLGSVTQDSTTKTSNTIQALGSQKANYIRNSVKATVDAYDGSVELYAWDANDPVLKAWEKIFPGQYHPISEISGDLMSTCVTRRTCSRYSASCSRNTMCRPQASSSPARISGRRRWIPPNRHGAAAGRSAAPVLPVIADRRVEEAGVLADLLVHPRRHVHARNPHRLPVGGFRRGQRKGRNRAELRHDTIAGAAQGLQRSRTGAGAEQLQRERGRVEGAEPARIRFHQGQPRQPADTAAGWRLVYVQPVYVQSSGSTSFPLLKKVLVAFGDQVGFANTLDEALDQVFGGNSGASAGDARIPATRLKAVTGRTALTPVMAARATATRMAVVRTRARTRTVPPRRAQPKPRASASAEGCGPSDEDSQSAMKNGDWTAYGEAQKQLEEALNKAIELDGGK